MNWIKRLVILLYIVVVALMAMATILEKTHGADFAYCHVYGSAWFITVWALLALTAIVYIFRRKVRRPSILALHLAFILILLGAFATHIAGVQGYVHMRVGEATTTFFKTIRTNERTDYMAEQLPFALTLNSFRVICHDGTSAVYDYESKFVIADKDAEQHAKVSMNNICSYRGYRFYQNSYDEDLEGTTLSVNYDPYGIPLTYTGYALLFVSLVLILFDPKGHFRQTLRDSAKGVAMVLLLLLGANGASAATTLNESHAERLSRLSINYNERICPLETFALDFTQTVTGKRRIDGYSATQVVSGFMLFADEWNEKPLIRVKSAAVREYFGLGEHVALSDLIDNDEYKLERVVTEYYRGNHDELHSDAKKLDETLMLVVGVSNHSLLRLFPSAGVWLSPNDAPTDAMDSTQRQYIGSALSLLSETVRNGDEVAINKVIDKIEEYQHRYGGESLPSPLQQWSEHAYNALPYTTILFIVCLTLGLLSLLPLPWVSHWLMPTSCFGSLTLVMMLRWIITGTIPMANGYETMLLMAWLVLLISLFMRRRFPIFHTLGLLMSGFFLLVSHISSLSPQIGHIMPVLQSPLLSIHVSIIIMAYALLSITAVCGLVGLMSKATSHRLMQISVLMHYPAMACLGIGIFVGAIWANVSWGTYWSWDPKETWALITLMVYAVPMHKASVPQLCSPRAYHTYMLCAFVSVIITYFGVNYLLGGMHSYA